MDSILEDFVKQVHAGELDGSKIDNRLYFKTAQRLAGAIINAFPTEMSYEDPLNSLAATLQGNIYAFSGAKTMTQASLLSKLITDDNGKLKPFSQYRQDVDQFLKDYNERYLDAEYTNAIASAQSAVQWQQWDDEDWLEYRTVGDNRVRDSHRLLDNLVLPKNSPVWDRIYPPNDWMCRCTVIPADPPKNPMSDAEAGKLGKKVVTKKMFENNPGKSRIVYSNEHPYFNAIKQELDPILNYGMRPVEKIMKDENLPAPLITKESEFKEWWNGKADNNGAFGLTDDQGYSVEFNSQFLEHLDVKKQGRYRFAINLESVFKDADEKWFNQGKSTNTWVYIKYFKDYPYILIVEEKKGKLVAQTFYRADNLSSFPAFLAKRKGVLLKRK